ncbi:MAG TPA: hypothetical protein VGP93_11310, partial [Polyangiaceae bacterium]|nr:hypothetical protein [Polyangiaceae bacterium]
RVVYFELVRHALGGCSEHGARPVPAIGDRKLRRSSVGRRSAYALRDGVRGRHGIDAALQRVRGAEYSDH